MSAKTMQRLLVKLDDNVMPAKNKMERKCFVNSFLQSYRRKKALGSLNLYINENYEDIVTSS